MGRGNKYKIEANAEIDLHRYKLTDALNRVASFVESSKQSNFTVIKIITGKGIHSSDNNRLTIKEAVKDWLYSNGYRFNYAKQSDGGEGALLVFLK